jgi:hypothetical protein
VSGLTVCACFAYSWRRADKDDPGHVLGGQVSHFAPRISIPSFCFCSHICVVLVLPFCYHPNERSSSPGDSMTSKPATDASESSSTGAGKIADKVGATQLHTFVCSHPARPLCFGFCARRASCLLEIYSLFLVCAECEEQQQRWRPRSPGRNQVCSIALWTLSSIVLMLFSRFLCSQHLTLAIDAHWCQSTGGRCRYSHATKQALAPLSHYTDPSWLGFA